MDLKWLSLMAFGMIVAPVAIRAQNDNDDDDNENVGLAFGLVFAAGASTLFGACLVFCDKVFLQDKFEYLGAALGFAAGIMLFIATVELFGESAEQFEECDCLWDDGKDGEAAAFLMAVFMFFLGVLITYFLDFLVHQIFDRFGMYEIGASKLIASVREEVQAQANAEGEDPEKMQLEPAAEDGDDTEDAERREKLHKMGVLTAFAIGLHNFPEGLATFIGTLADPAVGAALAIAIGIHNIPEGICVAIPIYYATGSRWKGFFYAVWSGVSEPIAALLAFLFLRDVVGPAVFAVTLGLVSGIMTSIVIKELIPTANAYDPQNKYAIKSVFVGAFVMAMSLVLFEF